MRDLKFKIHDCTDLHITYRKYLFHHTMVLTDNKIFSDLSIQIRILRIRYYKENSYIVEIEYRDDTLTKYTEILPLDEFLSLFHIDISTCDIKPLYHKTLTKFTMKEHNDYFNIGDSVKYTITECDTSEIIDNGMGIVNEIFIDSNRNYINHILIGNKEILFDDYGWIRDNKEKHQYLEICTG